MNLIPEIKNGDARDLKLLGEWYNDLVRLQFEFSDKADDARRRGDFVGRIEFAWKAEYSRLHGIRFDTLRHLIICKPYGGKCNGCGKTTEDLMDWYEFRVCKDCLGPLQCTFDIIMEELK
jgi:hypothetical protein